MTSHEQAIPDPCLESSGPGQTFLETLADIVRQGRQSLAMTQEDLSRKAGVSRSLVDRMENGRLHDPKMSCVLAVLKALDLRIDVASCHPSTGY